LIETPRWHTSIAGPQIHSQKRLIPVAWRAMLVEIESASVLVGDNRRMGKE
jgi:hypothetical protein